MASTIQVDIVSAEGGTAFRLTSHEGQELYPKFSPDGSQIAFSAEYNGTRQVYVMPSSGGTPRQLTWYNDVGPMPPRGGTDNRVLDWTPDGQHVVVRMNRLPYDERAGQPYLVPVAGGMETPMVVPETGGGMLSPDGGKFVIPRSTANSAAGSAIAAAAPRTCGSTIWPPTARCS